MRIAWNAALLVSMLIANLSSASGQAGTRIATGIVKSVSAQEIEITLSANYGPGFTQGSNLPVRVAPGLAVKPQNVYAGRQALALSDLEPGDFVMIRFTGNPGAYTATAVTLNSTEGRKKNGDFTRNVKPAPGGTVDHASVTRDASTQNLDETFAFLKSALQTYGKTQPTAYNPGSWYETSDVQFRGCVMQFNEKFYQFNGDVLADTIYTVNLRDLRLSGFRFSQEKVTLDTIGSIHSIGQTLPPYDKIKKHEKTYHKTGGSLKLVNDVQAEELYVEIHPRHQDESERRITEAFAHAARLCGAKPLPGERIN